MIEEPQDLRVENALLRGTLWITARALKNYTDSAHVENEDGKLELAVVESVREKGVEALERAEKMLKEPERGVGR